MKQTMKIDINQIITRANDEIPEEEYLVMLNASEIIDCVIPPEERPFMSVKYSCFDGRI